MTNYLITKGRLRVNRTAPVSKQTFDKQRNEHQRANVQLDCQMYTEHVRNLSEVVRPAFPLKVKTNVHGNGLTARYVAGRVTFGAADAVLITPDYEPGHNVIRLLQLHNGLQRIAGPCPRQEVYSNQRTLCSGSHYPIRYVNATPAFGGSVNRTGGAA